jgi:hypothetical protein
MDVATNPQLFDFVLTMSRYLLIGFGIVIAGATLVYLTLFWKGNLSGASIIQIVQQTDVPKLATIILIVLTASLLGLLGIIKGEAVIALLSAIAGYVLGNRASESKPPAK